MVRVNLGSAICVIWRQFPRKHVQIIIVELSHNRPHAGKVELANFFFVIPNSQDKKGLG